VESSDLQARRSWRGCCRVGGRDQRLLHSNKSRSWARLSSSGLRIYVDARRPTTRDFLVLSAAGPGCSGCIRSGYLRGSVGRAKSPRTSIQLRIIRQSEMRAHVRTSGANHYSAANSSSKDSTSRRRAASFSNRSQRYHRFPFRRQLLADAFEYESIAGLAHGAGLAVAVGRKARLA
jgi:hypothetical protein